jgi:hypothetical protein
MLKPQEQATKDVLDTLKREYPYLSMAYEAIKERFRRDLGPEDDYHFACTGLSEMYVGSLIQHLSFTEEFAITHFAPKDHPYHRQDWNPFDGGADFDDFILHLAPRDEDMAAAWVLKLSEMGLPSARCEAMIERASNVYTSDEAGIRYFAESCIPQVPTPYLMKELASLREVLAAPASSVAP